MKGKDRAIDQISQASRWCLHGDFALSKDAKWWCCYKQEEIATKSQSNITWKDLTKDDIDHPDKFWALGK